MKHHIPNLLTLLNLLLGCVAIICALNDKLYAVPYLVIAAAIADFGDGFAARMLKVSSPLGLQLDSLADMVTFGVVPGMTMYCLLQNAWETESATLWQTLPAFLLTLFSALRLAKFNIDTRQSDSFIGLPTPANTLFIVSLIWVAQSEYGFAAYLQQPIVLYIITVLFSYLLIAELPMLSNKIKHFGIKGNEKLLVFVVGALLLVLLLGRVGVSFSIIWYLLLSIMAKFGVGNKIPIAK
jgi:CDP-diacylglycerol--serine O-phosphatidyltransferase